MGLGYDSMYTPTTYGCPGGYGKLRGNYKIIKKYISLISDCAPINSKMEEISEELKSQIHLLFFIMFCLLFENDVSF